jgi:type I restriction enzyme R subunit
VLEELIGLAKDIRARMRGEETGLSAEEIAFYDAPAQNESARDVMGEPALRVIAHELVQVIKSNISVDWMHRASARANIRRHVKRLLENTAIRPTFRTQQFRTSCSKRRRFRRNGPNRHRSKASTTSHPAGPETTDAKAAYASKR